MGILQLCFRRELLELCFELGRLELCFKMSCVSNWDYYSCVSFLFDYTDYKHLIETVKTANALKIDGILIVEHFKKVDLSAHNGYQKSHLFGNVCFRGYLPIFLAVNKEKLSGQFFIHTAVVTFWASIDLVFDADAGHDSCLLHTS